MSITTLQQAVDSVVTVTMDTGLQHYGKLTRIKKDKTGQPTHLVIASYSKFHNQTARYVPIEDVVSVTPMTAQLTLLLKPVKPIG